MNDYRLVDLCTLSAMLGGRSRASIYRDIRNQPGFPQPVKIGCSTRFRLEDVERYLRNLPAARRA